ncbi:ABC transporter permease [Allonocardiopsis opalescens]|uniref:NitT/TauT family transport system permease protein/sulfonate transport system permease protein n=1 Tax=Allonocardiopsis opalescens TaxID=1144618 RepID=A0A2T0QEG1_9ACTN|nr:ABC transporter permease subunit [Allonocardiopsis opalescens]PRY02270.1 NitT/TauT family transport system permease protein/sulfonate transport system permease protein [Allonocardiopsis opalescens]
MSAAAAAAPAVPRERPRLRAALQHAAFALALLAAWEIGSRLLGSALLLPPPGAVLAAMAELTASGELVVALGQSLLLLVLGLAAALVVGFVFGVLIGRSRIAYWTLSPYFSALFVIPTVALVPLVLVWFGFGMGGRVIIVLLAGLVPVLLSVAAGVRDAPGELVEVARSFGLRGELRLLIQVRLRAAVPLLMSGMRLAVGRAVVGMAVAESYLRLGGIGGLIRNYGSSFQTEYVFAAILPLTLLGIGLSALVGLVERRFQRWQT